MTFKLVVERSEIIKGAIIYGVFDTIAAWVLGEFSWLRFLGMTLIGGSIYAIEIPSYFAWLESKSQTMSKTKGQWFKTLMTVAYFNPLWIARHMCFIYLFNQQILNWDIWGAAWQSFIYGMPISAAANFLIQNKVPINHRFLASSLFSGCMAIFYAVSAVVFK